MLNKIVPTWKQKMIARIWRQAKTDDPNHLLGYCRIHRLYYFDLPHTHREIRCPICDRDFLTKNRIKTLEQHKTVCNLCSIPEREEVIYMDEHIFLVSTKDLKGHKIRVMACIYEHRVEPTFAERSRAYSCIIAYMSSVMNDCEWLLVDGKYASCPDHWHLVASDTLGTPEELEALEKTPTIKMIGTGYV